MMSDGNVVGSNIGINHLGIDNNLAPDEVVVRDVINQFENP